MDSALAVNDLSRMNDVQKLVIQDKFDDKLGHALVVQRTADDYRVVNRVLMPENPSGFRL